MRKKVCDRQSKKFAKERPSELTNLSAARGTYRGSKVTDVYPGVTDVYRNGLLHMISRGSPFAHISTTLVQCASPVLVMTHRDDSSRCLRVQAVHADLVLIWPVERPRSGPFSD